SHENRQRRQRPSRAAIGKPSGCGPATLASWSRSWESSGFFGLSWFSRSVRIHCPCLRRAGVLGRQPVAGTEEARARTCASSLFLAASLYAFGCVANSSWREL